MDDQEQSTRPPSRTNRHRYAEASAHIEERAEAALKRINRYPAALDPSPERRARWLSAAAKMAAAAADFAVLAAEGTEDSFLVGGRHRRRAARFPRRRGRRSVDEAQEHSGTIGYFAIRSEWGNFGASLASGDSDGERGQRLLTPSPRSWRRGLAAEEAPALLRSLGPALRLLRRESGMRQVDTAKQAWVTKAMLSAYENRKRFPSLRSLARILDALDARLLDLAVAVERVQQRQK